MRKVVVKRSKKRLVAIGLLVAFGLLAHSAYTEPCHHIVRTYEVDGLTYADYVSGDDSFHHVYIEDVPQYIRNSNEE